MPESSTAMPTPLPSTPAAAKAAGCTCVAALESCKTLPLRLAARLGMIAVTSARAANDVSAADGMTAEMACTDT
jgi:hypothetical protein